MIIVLDTNVIISALLSPSGPPAEIINHWEADRFEVVTSPPLLSELERVLQYPRVQKHLSRSPDEIAAFTNRFRTVATVVEPQLSLEVIKDDPADNRVLECALVGGAAYIVSGNDHLLDLKDYREIVILNPREFLALLEWGT
jgi:putative PIN family toxin of toxin-antitoxin system